MLNIRFLACTKLKIGPDSLYCGKWGNFLNAYSDLGLTKLNIELARTIFIYYNVFHLCS